MTTKQHLFNKYYGHLLKPKFLEGRQNLDYFLNNLQQKQKRYMKNFNGMPISLPYYLKQIFDDDYSKKLKEDPKLKRVVELVEQSLGPTKRNIENPGVYLQKQALLDLVMKEIAENYEQDVDLAWKRLMIH